MSWGEKYRANGGGGQTFRACADCRNLPSCLCAEAMAHVPWPECAPAVQSTDRTSRTAIRAALRERS